MLHKLKRYSCIYKTHEPTVQHLERSDAIEICDKIIFDFDTGLSQMCAKLAYSGIKIRTKQLLKLSDS